MGAKAGKQNNNEINITTSRGSSNDVWICVCLCKKNYVYFFFYFMFLLKLSYIFAKELKLGGAE